MASRAVPGPRAGARLPRSRTRSSSKCWRPLPNSLIDRGPCPVLEMRADTGIYRDVPISRRRLLLLRRFTDLARLPLLAFRGKLALLFLKSIISSFGRIYAPLCEKLAHVSSSFHPMRACTSMTGSAFNGATPIAIANATNPSIRPTERFLDGLRLPASSTAITVLAAHIESRG